MVALSVSKSRFRLAAETNLRSVADGAPDDDAGELLADGRVRRELAPDRGRDAARVDHDDVALFGAVDRFDRLGPVARVGAFFFFFLLNWTVTSENRKNMLKQGFQRRSTFFQMCFLLIF